MKTGNEYLHYKDNTYTFSGIALPLQEMNISVEVAKKVESKGVARHHENTHDLELFAIDGILLIDSDLPYVIYQSEEQRGTDECWAREVDDFFGYVEKDDKFVPRFKRIED